MINEINIKIIKNKVIIYKIKEWYKFKIKDKWEKNNKKNTDKYYLKNELSKKIVNFLAMPLRSHAWYFCRNIDILLKYHDISPISPFFLWRFLLNW